MRLRGHNCSSTDSNCAVLGTSGNYVRALFGVVASHFAHARRIFPRLLPIQLRNAQNPRQCKPEVWIRL